MDISSNVKILDENTLVLESDAKKGDTISLNKITSIDKSFLEKAIKEKYKEEFALTLTKEIELVKKEKDIEIKKLQDKIDSFDNLKRNEISKINSENTLENTKNLMELKNKYNEKINELNNTIKEYQNRLEIEKTNKEKDIEIETNKVKSELKEQINNLENKLDSINKIKEYELKEKISELEKEHNETVNALKIDIDKLKLEKNSLNNKQLGEQLEKWCVQEYNNYAVAGFKDCEFVKMNDSIKEEGETKATKPDFKFVVYLDKSKQTILTSVCLEMKNEFFNDSINKKKNEDHYSKLDKDRNKNGLEYALLVSELDWTSSNDSPIVKVNNFEKMYMVRPQYFITFLSLITTLANKYKEMITEKYRKDELFAKKDKIIEDFNSLKETYLNKPLNSLTKEIEEVRSNSTKIRDLNNKNIEALNKILEDKIETFKTKIEKFDINKITKQIDKLDV